MPFPSPVHESEVAQSCSTLSNPMDCSPPGSSVHGIFQARVLEWGAIASIANSWILLKLMSIESGMPSNHLIFCRPLLFLPSIFPSNKVFSDESVIHIGWPKYWNFSFNITPSNEHPGLISFKCSIKTRQWHPTPVLLPGESHGRRSLVSCSP